MRLHKIQPAAALVLALLLLLNPVADAAGSALFAGADQVDTAAAPASAPGRNFDLEQGLETLLNRGVFDSLLETTGSYFGDILQDPRLKEILGDIIEEILADERIATMEALAVEILRNERLTQILGDVISGYLGDEELYSFIEQITGDIAALLRNDAFVAFFQQAVTGLLHDEGINEFAVEIIEALLVFPGQILDRLEDGNLEQAVFDVAEQLGELFKQPLLDHASQIMADPRVSEALDKILNRLKELPPEYAKALLTDEAFQEALQDLTGLFLEPLQDLPRLFLKRLIETGTPNHLLDLFLVELFNEAYYGEVSILLD